MKSEWGLEWVERTTSHLNANSMAYPTLYTAPQPHCLSGFLEPYLKFNLPDHAEPQWLRGALLLLFVFFIKKPRLNIN